LAAREAGPWNFALIGQPEGFEVDFVVGARRPHLLFVFLVPLRGGFSSRVFGDEVTGLPSPHPTVLFPLAMTILFESRSAQTRTLTLFCSVPSSLGNFHVFLLCRLA